MHAPYPFSAVVGQEPLKLALLLCAIDPALGGVLVRGPRGVAKTTLARALAAFVPGPFVELPLGATEERLTGSIELGSALREGRIALAEGLLARAHQGVLYVDEVNLLPDGLVDLLLDAAASGVNVVERDGISQRHAARFVLVGTMNPEEGELRPQLTDRFGLAVNAAAQIAPADRTRIVALRLAFDRDPAAFAARYAAEERALDERCARARELASVIELDEAALADVSERCFQAGVEGVRADLAMLRAARAHAAWHGRSAITAEDIAAVAELALQHRRTPGGPSGSGGGGSTSGGSPTRGDAGAGASSARHEGRSQAQGKHVRHEAMRTAAAGTQARMHGDGDAHARSPVRSAGARSHDARGADDGDAAGSARAGDWGARAAVTVPVLPLSPQLLAQLPAAQKAVRAQNRGLHRLPHAAHGVRRAQATRVDWFRTLLTLRTGGAAPRFRPARTRALWVVAVDCSGSMLRKGALSYAKGIACELGRRARAQRAAMHLITFGGAAAHMHRAIIHGATLDRALVALGAGGGTPLRHALIDALRVSRRHRGAREQRFFLLSDGRSRTRLADLADIGQTMEAVVIDCERARPRLGGARTIAQHLHASYVALD
jgi:magnesium chelatase subunit D